MPEGPGDSRTNNDSVSNGQANQNNAIEEPPSNRTDPPRGGSFFDIAKSLIVRAIFIYFITSFFRRSYQPESTVTSSGSPKIPALNYFENGSIMDLYVYLSEDENISRREAATLIWEEKGLMYGDWDNEKAVVHTFKTSYDVRNNGSIYLLVYFIKREEDNVHSKDKMHIASGKKQLNKYKKNSFVKTQNLLTGASQLSEEDIEKAEKTSQTVLSYWHPNITINLLTDFTNWVEDTLPSGLSEHFEFSPGGRYYKPVVFFNDYWNLQRDYYPINDTTEELTLSISYYPLSLFKWQLYTSLAKRPKISTTVFQDDSNENDADQDSIKETLIETSPYLLAITIIVSFLHSIFEFLAFKNDIQFWKDRKSLEGLSVRLVFFNVFQSTICLLYILDNETNTFVKISCFAGLLIEVWKVNKVVDISFDRTNKILGFIPRPLFADKGSYVESSTKEYDQLAFKYLSWVFFPLLGAYSIYSLIYQEHRGWYSWLLNMIYGFLLTFGFITMTPQLFINYKLKSVAHLPWRMMTYKCLNTFIDDVFAFVIKMPTMYRLGCFRDDVIFFIFLYQRWIYKTDHTRVNEFGFSGEMEQQKEQSPSVQEPTTKSIEAKKDD